MTIPATQAKILPQAFIWRRLHSLTGLWLVIYLTLHLFTNSQAALLIGNDGSSFIRSVNAIQDLPYLPVIEIAILAFPILIHLAWGIKYMLTAKYNSFGNTGHAPYLPEYPRNHAYTWQRITAWLLIAGIIAHIVHMRVIEHPILAFKGSERSYLIRVTGDPGLHSLAARLGVALYGKEQLSQLKNTVNLEQEKKWLKVLEKHPLRANEYIAAANNFGTVELLMVRDTFKMPLMLVLYTLLVLTACFHAFNGFWTSMITWGVSLSVYSQLLMKRATTFLMILVAGFGLAAIWLTYWVNLKQ